MQTECPHCHTIFRITDEQIEIANSQARCGHCLAIFTVENPYYNNIDNNIDFDIETESDEELPEVIPPKLRHETLADEKYYSLTGTLFLTLSLLSMIFIGLLQYTYYNRLQLVQNNDIRPWLDLLCENIECNLPEPRDPNRVELSNKNIFAHPNIDNALMISATIVNQAEFEQDFPFIELHFEDIRGRHIAGRIFKPVEYLGIPQDQITKMSPANPISFNIEIFDAGKPMIGYEFDFL